MRTTSLLSLTTLLTLACSSEVVPEAGKIVQGFSTEGATVTITSEWSSGYCADVAIVNVTVEDATSWDIDISLNDATLRNSWNADVTVVDGVLQAEPSAAWNSSVSSNGERVFGYCANKTGDAPSPTLEQVTLYSGENVLLSSTSATPVPAPDEPVDDNPTPPDDAPSDDPAPMDPPPATGGLDDGTGGSTSAGGTASGGSETGGASAGGSETGGASAGGSETGGTSAGGSETGGTSAGGSETGGTSAGGSETGGSGGGSEPSSNCGLVTYEAEAMDASRGGPISGGWNLWSNGTLSTDHEFEAGPAVITVWAAGEPAAGTWPHMIVSVDGVPVGDVSVSTGDFAGYEFSFDAPSDTVEVAVEFDNDHNSGGEDRNLLLDRIDIDCDGTGSGNPGSGGSASTGGSSSGGSSSGGSDSGGTGGGASSGGSSSGGSTGGPGPDPGSIVYFNDFNDDPTGNYSNSTLAADWNSPDWNNGVNDGRVSIFTGGAYDGKSMRVEFPQGSVGPNAGGAQWRMDLPGGYDELFVSYAIRFGNGFDFVLGGKIPGLCGGSCKTGGGGAPSDGFSARGMWRSGGDAVQYMYYYEQDGHWGEDFDWNRGGQFEYQPGTWHVVEHRIVLNTPGQSNGVVEAWVDGEKVLEKTGLRFRPNGQNFQIDSFYFSTFFGGNSGDWAATDDEVIDFDNFIIATQPITH